MSFADSSGVSVLFGGGEPRAAIAAPPGVGDPDRPLSATAAAAAAWRMSLGDCCSPPRPLTPSLPRSGLPRRLRSGLARRLRSGPYKGLTHGCCGCCFASLGPGGDLLGYLLAALEEEVRSNPPECAARVAGEADTRSRLLPVWLAAAAAKEAAMSCCRRPSNMFFAAASAAACAAGWWPLLPPPPLPAAAAATAAASEAAAADASMSC